jgi:ABC-type cobalamin/Fe3+-siderophores transport system ATPase subunit
MQTPAGQMVGMIERSRAGKSTLLRLINCLIDPTRSTIYWREVNITAIKGGGGSEPGVGAAPWFSSSSILSNDLMSSATSSSVD